MAAKITKTNLDDFKKLVRKAIFLDRDDEVYFNSIPDATWTSIFKTNFNGNFNYAQRVILNKFKDIEKIDHPRLDREKSKIFNLDKATKCFLKAASSDVPIIFITDYDNDGSLSQSIINEYLKADVNLKNKVIVEYAQTINGNSNRGITVDLVDKIVSHHGLNPDGNFLILTADNGINSLEEQLKINAQFPNADLIITDHHNPEPEMVIQENNKTMIFNPHYNPTPFFKEFNISGATTIGVLLKNVLSKRLSAVEYEAINNNLKNIDKLSKVSNLLDYVNTDPVDKPEKDYVINKFLQLQPLLNINNSISKIILNGIPDNVLDAIQNKMPDLDRRLVLEEVKNIQTQNKIAKMLLKIHSENKDKDKLTEGDLFVFMAQELTRVENVSDGGEINKNFIEQLRPLIFGLSADDEKNVFLDVLNDKMIGVFESIKESEKSIAEELRKGEVITKNRLENSVITYTDKDILSVFNRKYLNKIYNDENPGFTLTLDNIEKEKVSGSFRSLYNISDILKNKPALEKKLSVKIETPGHERAAGFIVKSTDSKKQITAETIDEINKFINKSIEKIKAKEFKQEKEQLLIDLGAIHLVDRINVAIRGNISNFERISPVLKITPDTIWTDSYTTKQYTMEDIVKDRKYGYVSINTNFDGGTVIVPVELIRKVVKNEYKDYLSLSYMDEGVFMVEKTIPESQVKNVIDLRNKYTKSNLIDEVFSTDLKDTKQVDLTREQIKDNPFFKYHDYGNLHFDQFERMVIEIIDANKVDMLAVFDVEANGFGNSKLMNIGSMNYTIDEKSGKKMDVRDFTKNLFHIQRGEEFLLTEAQVSELKEISQQEKEELSLFKRKQVLIQKDEEGAARYYLHPSAEEQQKKKNIVNPFTSVTNYIVGADGLVTYNREIKATMLAYLVTDKDFKVPQEMTYLTGITQELLRKHGTETAIVDKEFTGFYKGKEVLFGAHNTPYDARVVRANMPEFYEFFKGSKIYDSALFAREEKLAYDEVKVSSFPKIAGIPSNIYFYDNELSDFSLTKFIKDNKNGYYPDRTGQYSLEIDNGEYFLVDKVRHDKVKVEATNQELVEGIYHGPIPNISIKYSVESLSEQWMIRSLLLLNEDFNIKLVDLSQDKYKDLRKNEDALIFLQEHYHFDSSPMSNFYNFKAYFYDVSFDGVDEKEVMTAFLDEFLTLNKDIQQKFSDAWMYKKVLSIKDPVRTEITNDLIDLVNYQTNIPTDKIKDIFNAAINFKEKYGVSHVLQHEGHINGPWRGDDKGDIAFEDKLTLSLLTQRMNNPYSHDIKDAVNVFNRYATKARLAFDMADNLSSSLAEDSYSYRQGLLYDRPLKTDLVSGIQNKEKSLSDPNLERVIKFKLENDVLPQDSGVYAITRKNMVLSRDDIEQDTRKLSFILVNEQIRNSLDNVPASARPFVESILQANDAISLDYKTQLSQHYSYVEYNRRDFQFKRLIEASLEGIDVVDKKMKKTPLHDLTKDDVAIVKKIFQGYVKNMVDSGKDIEDEAVKKVWVYLDNLHQNMPETSLERAMSAPENRGITNFKEVKDRYFLHDTSITRRDPLKTLFNKHMSLRMTNKVVEDSIDFVSGAFYERIFEEKPITPTLF